MDDDLDLDISPEKLARLRNEDAEVLRQNDAILNLVGHFADQIRSARKFRGWEQSDLAAALGISEARISQIESGRLRDAPSLRTIALVAHHLECDLVASMVPRGANMHVGGPVEIHVPPPGQRNWWEQIQPFGTQEPSDVQVLAVEDLLQGLAKSRDE
jgi:transcriptional regulator with XRE-family HTH domain